MYWKRNLCLRAGLEDHLQLAEPLVGEPEVPLEVDPVAQDAERLARNGHVGGRVPEAGGGFDVEALAEPAAGELMREAGRVPAASDIRTSGVQPQ